jgi:hypothetical protein
VIKASAIFFVLLAHSHRACAQIDPSGLSAQTIGYWNLNEKQSYAISYTKYRVNGNDTTSTSKTTYQVDVLIKDSTANSYLIEWFYRDILNDSEQELVKKLYSVAEDISVLIRTDEFGAIQEVVNWEGVRDRTNKTLNILKEEFGKDPAVEALFTSVTNLYQSKESVESGAIKDAQQFYSFHGAAYTLGEDVKGTVQLPNAYGKKPFDAEMTVQLSEIDTVDQNYVIRMSQSVDAKQLTDATYNFLKTLAGDGAKLPKRKEFPMLWNETWTASRIHGPSGWIIYSIETKSVSSDGVTQIEERIIELL